MLRLILIFGLLAGPVWADETFLNGDQVLEQCPNFRANSDAFNQPCIRRVLRTWDLAGTKADMLEDDLPFCIPDGATVRNIAETLLLYVEQNPHRRHLQGDILLVEAFKVAFPCQ